MGNSWPQPVWQALNQLAELDLSHYGSHVFDREKFLGTARAKRADQHRAVIESMLATNPRVTCDELVAVCNPAPRVKPDPLARTAAAQARLYALNDVGREPLPAPPVDCVSCANEGVVDGVLCTCERGRFVAFVRSMTKPPLVEEA